MGQYYIVVNIDKKQYIHPHRLGDGLKLGEIMHGFGTTAALVTLLADGNGRGGGDLRSNASIVGTWAGDRIVIAGDYADDGSHVPEEHIAEWRAAPIEDGDCIPEEDEVPKLYMVAERIYRDVSADVMCAMAESEWMRERLAKEFERWNSMGVYSATPDDQKRVAAALQLPVGP